MAFGLIKREIWQLTGLWIKHSMNNKINRFAEILELKLKQGGANLTVKLKGETEPVNVSLDYAIEGDVLCISNVETSKEWLNALAEVFKERYSRIHLNGIYAKLLSIAL